MPQRTLHNGRTFLALCISIGLSVSQVTAQQLPTPDGTPIIAPSPILRLPAVGNWNGYLQHVNVIECTNHGSSMLPLTISVRDPLGQEIGNRSLNLEPDSTSHTILNDFAIADSYGTFTLDLSQGSDASLALVAERLSCHTIIYHYAPTGSAKALEYAFALPVRNPAMGITGGSFNSFDPENSGNPTFNWLSIVNPNSSGAIDLTIALYDQTGSFTSSFSTGQIGAGQRRDFALGHDDTAHGGQVAGLYRVIPSTTTTKYMAFVTRIAQRGTQFRFAFPLESVPGQCDGQFVSLSTMNPATNWLEVINFGSTTAEVNVVIRNTAGAQLQTLERSLAPYSQEHIYINSVLGDNNIGTAQITCDDPNNDAILVQSLFYGHLSQQTAPAIEWAYGAQAVSIRALQGTELAFPVNTYLGAANWLKLFNENSGAIAAAVDLVGSDTGAGSAVSASLQANQTQDVGLHSTYFSADHVGSARVNSSTVDSIVGGELLRVFPHQSASIGTILRLPGNLIIREAPTVVAEDVTSNVFLPLDITNAGDGSNRLFVSEKGGTVRIIKNGTVLSTPFLDLTTKITPDWATTESGMQSIVFHPNFAQNGRFFVAHNDINGDSRVAEYGLTGNPDVADLSSERILLTVLQTETFHQGGQLQFGPDGFLYFALGDGGPQEDPNGNGQNNLNLHGTIMRIDVDGAQPYEIPADNPFVNDASALDEIWAYGFRNPWRFSFDRVTGRMFSGDVGQDTIEEVNIITKGGNYGWNVMEGGSCFNPAVNCDASGLVLPILDYTRDDGASVTGGYVYRGNSIPGLYGRYVFSDWTSNKIWYLTETSTGGWHRRELLTAGSRGVVSFGEDETGELYVVGFYAGDTLGFVRKLTTQ